MQEQSNRIYRLRPYYRNVGIASAALWICAWVGSVLAAYFNVDGSFARLGYAIVFFSVVYGFLTSVGVWLIFAYVRNRLFLGEETVTQVGILRTRTISFRDIKELEWRMFPSGGRAVLSGCASTIKIDFNEFTNTERAEIVAFLRARIDDERQTDWEAFHDRYIADSPERARRQRSITRILILCLIVCTFVAATNHAADWIAGGGVAFLLIAIGHLPIAAWLALRYRRTGDAELDR